jgi:hypothetical protein
MKLSKLIEEYGDDKVQFQPLDGCATKMNYDHKKGTTITFGTPETVGPNGTTKMGLIVWMDRERVAEIIGKS